MFPLPTRNRLARHNVTEHERNRRRFKYAFLVSKVRRVYSQLVTEI